MKKILVRILFLILCLFAPYYGVYAEGEFRTDYDVAYAVSGKGISVVTQKVTLTNRLTNLFPKEYSITYDTQAIKNVIAFDGSGQIKPTVSYRDGKTVIRILFNEQVVGLGNQLSFTLRFENTEIAQKNGTIWEINIPGISDSKDLGSYYVRLDVPDDLGSLAYISPLPENSGRWSKDQMVKGGISAAYGSEQLFEVTANYILENTGNGEKLTEIAIPPDTSFQKVNITDISPKPVIIVPDEDQNWMARYRIPAHSSLKITVRMIISVKLDARNEYGKQDIDMNQYLMPTKYWNFKNQNIAYLASKYA